jgi:outer membrane immunogenic protein
MFFAGAASAADMALKARPAPVPVAVYNWTGFYIGGNVGYGWGENTGAGYSSAVDVGIGGLLPFLAGGGNVLPGLAPSGVIGGAQIGYNWQVAPAWVLGVVADIQASDIKASGTNTVSIGAFANIGESKSVKTEWFGTLRGKVGVAANNVLFYGTGGLAYGEIKASTSFNDPSFGGGPLVFAGSSSAIRAGWTAGAGIEWGFAPNWTAGFEYLYMDFGNLTVTETRLSGPLNASTFTSVSNFRDHIARVLVNYKF